jgi:hypothetical protein
MIVVALSVASISVNKTVNFSDDSVSRRPFDTIQDAQIRQGEVGGSVAIKN